jgi:F420-dependent methylenetetrahydromethanopterin dehydrogenase
MVNVTFVQAGYIGATTLIDALLDERASRKGISVRVISSGCKMDEAEAEAAAKIAAQVPTDLYVAVSPSAGLPGPKKMREVLKETGKPIIVVSDEPSRKAARKLPEEGIGYLVLYGDAMIPRPHRDGSLQRRRHQGPIRHGGVPVHLHRAGQGH